MQTTIEIDNNEWEELKLYCKKKGMTMKGLFLNGAKQIIEENERRTNIS